MTTAELLYYDTLDATSQAAGETAPETSVAIADCCVGEGNPVFVIAEIGINHNGSLSVAKRLIEGAKRAGCHAVKFQKRTPELCVPKEQWNEMRETPWGRMSYIDYKQRIELSYADFVEIDRLCRSLGFFWFASCWDEPSVDFIEAFDVPCYKAASASLTDHALLRRMQATGKPLIVSTGMSTWSEISSAVDAIGRDELLIAHSTSTYPCPPEQLNLRMIQTLKTYFPQCPVGYSGHEAGLASTWAAVALGATFVERHVTLDRTMWGTDQPASLELDALERLVSQIREVELAVGNGVKRVYESELGIRAKLRRRRHESQSC